MPQFLKPTCGPPLVLGQRYLVNGKLYEAVLPPSRVEGTNKVDSLITEEKTVSSLPQKHETNLIVFYVNGKKVSMVNPDPRMTLNDYLRSTPGLTGTKLTCGEGGCGSCSVMLTHFDASSQSVKDTLINSCYRLIPSIDGMSITTTEGIGSLEEGLHPIQTHLAACNGSQCGFCSPGMVMNCYTLLQNNPSPSSQEIEDHLDGNLCRCTGYRPILDSFKSLAASDFNPSQSSCKRPTRQQLLDIEDLCGKKKSNIIKISSQQRKVIRKAPQPTPMKTVPEIHSFIKSYKKQDLFLKDAQENYTWYRPGSLDALYDLILQFASYDVKLVVGNTSQIVYKSENPTVYLDITIIPELFDSSFQDNALIVGAALSISTFMDLLHEYSTYDQTLNVMADHLMKMANTQVRNAASWGGNVVLANLKGSSVSDILLVLLNKNATFLVGNAVTRKISSVSIGTFLTMDFTSSVLISVSIPTSNNNFIMKTFRTSLRHVNSGPIVSGAFSVLLSGNSIQSCSITYCGIESFPTSAIQTSQQLVGREVTNVETLQFAMTSLANELSSTKAYNNQEILSLFYKYFLSLQPTLPKNLLSAAQQYRRPVSVGELSYDTEPIEYPVSKFIPKFLSPLQASGEVLYTADTASKSSYHGVFVQSTVALADIISIDATFALSMPGVIGWVDASDIPGENNCEVNPHFSIADPLFADDHVFYNGQAIGLIVADSIRHAKDAAMKVVIQYNNIQTPILSVLDAIAANSYYPPGTLSTPQSYSQGDVASGLASSSYQISGSVTTPSQFHFHLEQQTSVALPDEGKKITIISATQWPTATQKQIARVLGISNNLVTVKTKRCGGAYGAKITRSIPIAAAAAVAATKFNHQVSIALDINTNMEMIGKRSEYNGVYSAGFDESGKISAYQIDLYSNGGYTLDLSVSTLNDGVKTTDNVYQFDNFAAKGYACQTNLPTNTAMRAPGCLPALFYVENMIERVAHTLQKDPKEIRESNFYQQNNTTPFGTPLINFNLPQIWQQIQSDANYISRKKLVDEWNATNRWIKKGISLIPIKYGIELVDRKFYAMVNICADGSVQISHNGVEIGQGVDTKCVQVASLMLACPVNLITVTSVDSSKTPDGSPTGASVTSSLCSRAVQDACAILDSRLSPVRSSLPPGTPFNVVASVAIANHIVCSASSSIHEGAPGDGEEGPFAYNTYGAAVSEIRLDVLTGDVQILRSDILYDCGISLNPAVDIGQVEGGFVTGIGYFVTEKLSYTAQGALSTNGTYTYKPPSHKDIPIDFRSSLLKDTPNPEGIVLGSKTAGEPPLCLSISVYWAIRHAIFDAATEANNGVVPPWTELSPPLTVDVIQQACGVDSSQFTIN